MSLITDEESFLTQSQRYNIMLASAYATKNKSLIIAMEIEAEKYLTADEISAAKSATAIMAMNNIYYRFIHLVNHKEFSTLPAKLRMNVIANPGIEKIDFELSCLAVSAINGCGLCIETHTQALLKAKLNILAIQSTIKIAAVINAIANTLVIINY
jgi:alkyl hydroperoxide reductase subunit D